MIRIKARIYGGDEPTTQIVPNAGKVASPAYGGGKLGTIVIGDLRVSELPESRSSLGSLYTSRTLDFRYDEDSETVQIQASTGRSLEIAEAVFYMEFSDAPGRRTNVSFFIEG